MFFDFMRVEKRCAASKTASQCHRNVTVYLFSFRRTHHHTFDWRERISLLTAIHSMYETSRASKCGQTTCAKFPGKPCRSCIAKREVTPIGGITMRQFALSNLSKPAVRGSFTRALCFAAWSSMALLVIAIMTPLGANAQMAGTGAISGTVTDTTGAVIGGATVTATSVDQNVSTVRTTTGAG